MSRSQLETFVARLVARGVPVRSERGPDGDFGPWVYVGEWSIVLDPRKVNALEADRLTRLEDTIVRQANAIREAK